MPGRGWAQTDEAVRYSVRGASPQRRSRS
jgi:hypothetical protein